MGDRDRLIELISQAKDKTPCSYNPDIDCEGIVCSACENGSISDYLLANGVILPPCKVGQTVYFVYETDNETMFIDKGTIQSFSIDENGIWFRAIYENLSSYWHTALSIGVTVFLTIDEAEKALEGMKNA